MRKDSANGWTEIARVIPGRSDNIIKNFWQYSMVKIQGQLDALLNAYLSMCRKTVPQDKDILSRVTKYLIRLAEKQYFDSLNAKRKLHTLEDGQGKDSGAPRFRHEIIEKLLDTKESLCRAASSLKSDDPAERERELRQKFYPLFFASIDRSQYAHFYQVFVSSKFFI